MRLFVAVNFSDETVDFLFDKVIRLKKQAVSITPSRRENLHLTLAFIGETTNVEKAKSIISDITFAPFEITLSGLGKFARDGGDIYWVGVNKCGDYDKLDAVAAEVVSRFRSGGFEIEKRRFSPHVTLGRQVILNGEASFSVPPRKERVCRISLMKSERLNGRLTYTEIFGKDAE